MKRFPLLVLALAAGCRPTAPETAPMAPEAPVVAVLPVVDETGRSSFDGEEFANLLASEWVKSSGARVIRPARLKADPKATTIVDAAALARKAGADLVLACAVTDCDPYDPPRLGVRVQLLRTEPRSLSTKDLDVLLQSASWHKGPLAMTREGAGHAVKSFEEVYDARDAATRQLLATYAQKASTRESELTAVQPRWLQFVSNQILRRAYGS
jgi:hypothetical protein